MAMFLKIIDNLGIKWFWESAFCWLGQPFPHASPPYRRWFLEIDI